MTRLLLIIFLFSVHLLHGQGSVFVLVDVSGSGPIDDVKAEAERIARDFCIGKYNNNDYKNWRWAGTKSSEIDAIVRGSGAALINPKQDGYLMIMPFGVKDRYEDYKLRPINSLNEVNEFFETWYPTVFEDAWTFIDVARAAAAATAKGSSLNLNSYYIIEISDQLKDTDSKAPNYSRNEQDWIAEYGTAGANEIKLGTLIHRSRKNYQIVFKKVQVSKIQIKPTNPPITSVTNKSFDLVRPMGTKAKPFNLESEQGALSLVWKCLGCDSTTIYSVRASNLDRNKKVKPISKKTQTSTARIVLPETGTYKISVNASDVGVETAYVEWKGGKSGGRSILPLLILLLLGIAGYFGWKYLNEKEENKSDAQDKKPGRTWESSSKGTTQSNPSSGDDLGRF